MRAGLVGILWLCCLAGLYAQDSVDVTFRYTIAGKTGVSVAGEFNGWNNTAWPMTALGGNLYVRTARLRVGGNPVSPGVPGAWQYKFYYAGAGAWPNDPLNHHINTADVNNNSFIIVKDPTIYQFLPNQRNPVVNSSLPTISAYLFPKVGASVDSGSLALRIDGTLITGLGSHYNITTKQFVYTPLTPLPNGSHTVILSAGTNADTVSFTTRGGFVQLLNQFPYSTRKPSWTLNGVVQDSSATTVRIVRNATDTFQVSASRTAFSGAVPLVEGSNQFVALGDSLGVTKVSSPVVFTRIVDHAPWAVITLLDTAGQVTLSAASSTDPDPGQAVLLTYRWGIYAGNPEPITGVDGSAAGQVSFSHPQTPGDYFFSLIARDPDGNADTTRDYITVHTDLSVTKPGNADNPAWASAARIYFLFPKGASSSGTLNASALRLQGIRDLGFNVVWLMPVMANAYPIDNNIGPGYNIIDFYKVAPEYGTNADLAAFIAQAHGLGLKVILDITPNHSSRFHPWSTDAHSYKTNSYYWNWYEHSMITANTNGLGDCLDADGFNYYCGFSDQLMNFNWADDDMRAEFISVLKYWITSAGADGYRFDVYWGPHRRYGEGKMGAPVRAALKHLKPDLLLLGEDDGTGPGTEVIYADNLSAGVRGGLDASYDFKLYFNQISGFGFSPTAIDNLNVEWTNAGYYPGEHALYLRFMESQDQDRIAYLYSGNGSLDATTTFMRTMPMASVLFTAPGVPMVWNGQEVGWGYGQGGTEKTRSRGVIDWNYQGRTLLAPHYQRIVTIRAQFPAFTQHKRDTNHDGAVTSADASDFVRITSSNSNTYAFTRPWNDQNGLTVVNFAGSPQATILNFVSGGGLSFTGGINLSANYYLNNLYDGTASLIRGSALSSVTVSLPAYGTGIYTLSLTRDSALITNPVLDVAAGRPGALPKSFGLAQNFPNPFNPSTTIRFDVPVNSTVDLRVYDIMGREVAQLALGERHPGSYTAQWDARGCSSGVYICRLTTDRATITRRMLLVR